MVRWFWGSDLVPTFERWAYWEKFDFFGAGSDIILIGTSGLILWFPNWFCIVPARRGGECRQGCPFHIGSVGDRFRVRHPLLRHSFPADKFPMDMSILTGVVSETEMHHERPELLARLHAEGRIEELRTPRHHAADSGHSYRRFRGLALGLAALAGIIWTLLV